MFECGARTTGAQSARRSPMTGAAAALQAKDSNSM